VARSFGSDCADSFASLRAVQSRGQTAVCPTWLKTLAELETSNPENAIVQASLGQRDLDDHRYDEAISHLQHSLRLDPLQPLVYVDLSAAQDQSGKRSEAIQSARMAVALEPFNPAFGRR